MSDTTPAELLTEMSALRRRARADRHGYWLPLLLFGVLIVAAAPLYVETWRLSDGDVVAGPNDIPAGELYSVENGGQAGRYWLAALIFGGLLTVWWYRWRGRRIGPQGAGAVAVGSAALAVAGAAVLGFLPLHWTFWPLERGYAATLVIAVGLIALTYVERSPLLATITAAYTAAALLANLYNVEDVLFRLGWDPFLAHPDQARFTPLPNLLLPGLVLLLAGAATGVTALVRRQR
jgi:hypothetical protein